MFMEDFRILEDSEKKLMKEINDGNKRKEGKKKGERKRNRRKGKKGRNRERKRRRQTILSLWK